jgi:hypothetical protein
MRTFVFPVAQCAVVALATILVAWPAVAQTARLDRQIEAEFRDEPVVTRIVVASFLRDQDDRGRQLTRLVDTEVYPDGSIHYLVRTGYVEPYGNMFARSYRTGPGALTVSFPIGSRLMVTTIEIMDDRIELWLKGGGELGYGKLKFMFGKGFQKNTSFDTVKAFIGRVAVTERLARAQISVAEFSALSDRVVALTIPPSGGTTATARLAHAQELRVVLRQIIANRTIYAVASNTAFDIEQYATRLREVEEQIRRLEEDSKREQVQALRTAYDAIVDEAKQLRATAGSQPAHTLADWKQQGEALTQWEANVRERTRIRRQVTSAGESVEAFDAEAELKAIESRRGAIEQDRQRIELAQLNADFKGLERRKIALLDAYTRAFGTPAQADSTSRLIDHLRTMQANRMAAQKAGQTGTAGQIAQINKEIERFRR